MPCVEVLGADAGRADAIAARMVVGGGRKYWEGEFVQKIEGNRKRIAGACTNPTRHAVLYSLSSPPYATRLEL